MDLPLASRRRWKPVGNHHGKRALKKLAKKAHCTSKPFAALKRREDSCRMHESTRVVPRTYNPSLYMETGFLYVLIQAIATKGSFRIVNQHYSKTEKYEHA